MRKQTPERIAYLKNYAKSPKRKAYEKKYAKSAASKTSKQRYQKKYYKMHGRTLREQVRLYQLWTNFKMTGDAYDNLLEKQYGCCALCYRTKTGRSLHVDHDHETGRIRGLLCAPHNRALGVLGDNETGVLCALAYIRG